MGVGVHRAGLAGAIYFAAIFALGFALGTVRVLWLAPQIGLVAATIVELPVMLAASAIVAHRLVRSFGLRRASELVVMGALGFALLLGAELILGVLAFGMTPNTWAANLLTGAGAIGLAGQIGFAAMPLIVSGLQKHPPRA